MSETSVSVTSVTDDLKKCEYHLATIPSLGWGPVERREDGGVKPPAGKLGWSTARVGGFIEPPKIGDRVVVNFNGFGAGTVMAYFREFGYLGVEVLLDKRPEWHVKQNGDKHKWPMVFGAEIVRES